MGKPPKPGPCIHCLKHFDELTWDHVLPKSWYPDTTPENLEKWKIPSCKECNKRYGELEEYLLFRLGLCIGPEEAKAAGISEKALRSIKPEYAKNDRDKRIRQGKREKIVKELIHFKELPKEGVFPDFGPQPHLVYGRYLGVLVSCEKLEALGEKLVRGITYLTENQLISEEHRIQVNFIEDGKAPQVQQLFETHTKVYHRGPGFVVARASAADDPISAILKIQIWGRLNIYAGVYRKEYEKMIEELKPQNST